MSEQGIGIEAEDEALVQNESHAPNTPFGPDEELQKPSADFISPTGDAEVVEATVRTDAPLTGITSDEAPRRGRSDDDVLAVTIERDGAVLTPHGDTKLRSDDVVSVLAQSDSDVGTSNVLLGEETT